MEHDQQRDILQLDAEEQEWVAARRSVWPISEAPELLAAVEQRIDDLASVDLSGAPQSALREQRKRSHERAQTILGRLREQVIPHAMGEEAQRYLRDNT